MFQYFYASAFVIYFVIILTQWVLGTDSIPLIFSTAVEFVTKEPVCYQDGEKLDEADLFSDNEIAAHVQEIRRSLSLDSEGTEPDIPRGGVQAKVAFFEQFQPEDEYQRQKSKESQSTLEEEEERDQDLCAEEKDGEEIECELEYDDVFLAHREEEDSLGQVSDDLPLSEEYEEESDVDEASALAELLLDNAYIINDDPERCENEGWLAHGVEKREPAERSDFSDHVVVTTLDQGREREQIMEEIRLTFELAPVEVAKSEASAKEIDPALFDFHIPPRPSPEYQRDKRPCNEMVHADMRDHNVERGIDLEEMFKQLERDLTSESADKAMHSLGESPESTCEEQINADEQFEVVFRDYGKEKENWLNDSMTEIKLCSVSPEARASPIDGEIDILFDTVLPEASKEQKYSGIICDERVEEATNDRTVEQEVPFLDLWRKLESPLGTKVKSEETTLATIKHEESIEIVCRDHEKERHNRLKGLTADIEFCTIQSCERTHPPVYEEIDFGFVNDKPEPIVDYVGTVCDERVEGDIRDRAVEKKMCFEDLWKMLESLPENNVLEKGEESCARMEKLEERRVPIEDTTAQLKKPDKPVQHTEVQTWSPEMKETVCMGEIHSRLKHMLETQHNVGIFEEKSNEETCQTFYSGTVHQTKVAHQTRVIQESTKVVKNVERTERFAQEWQHLEHTSSSSRSGIEDKGGLREPEGITYEARMETEGEKYQITEDEDYHASSTPLVYEEGKSSIAKKATVVHVGGLPVHVAGEIRGRADVMCEEYQEPCHVTQSLDRFQELSATSPRTPEMSKASPYHVSMELSQKTEYQTESVQEKEKTDYSADAIHRYEEDEVSLYQTRTEVLSSPSFLAGECTSKSIDYNVLEKEKQSEFEAAQEYNIEDATVLEVLINIPDYPTHLAGEATSIECTEHIVEEEHEAQTQNALEYDDEEMSLWELEAKMPSSPIHVAGEIVDYEIQETSHVEEVNTLEHVEDIDELMGVISEKRITHAPMHTAGELTNSITTDRVQEDAPVDVAQGQLWEESKVSLAWKEDEPIPITLHVAGEATNRDSLETTSEEEVSDTRESADQYEERELQINQCALHLPHSLVYMAAEVLNQSTPDRKDELTVESDYPSLQMVTTEWEDVNMDEEDLNEMEFAETFGDAHSILSRELPVEVKDSLHVAGDLRGSVLHETEEDSSFSTSEDVQKYTEPELTTRDHTPVVLASSVCLAAEVQGQTLVAATNGVLEIEQATQYGETNGISSLEIFVCATQKEPSPMIKASSESEEEPCMVQTVYSSHEAMELCFLKGVVLHDAELDIEEEEERKNRTQENVIPELFEVEVGVVPVRSQTIEENTEIILIQQAHSERKYEVLECSSTVTSCIAEEVSHAYTTDEIIKKLKGDEEIVDQKLKSDEEFEEEIEVMRLDEAFTEKEFRGELPQIGKSDTHFTEVHAKSVKMESNKELQSIDCESPYQEEVEVAKSKPVNEEEIESVKVEGDVKEEGEPVAITTLELEENHSVLQKYEEEVEVKRVQGKHKLSDCVEESSGEADTPADPCSLEFEAALEGLEEEYVEEIEIAKTPKENQDRVGDTLKVLKEEGIDTGDSEKLTLQTSVVYEEEIEIDASKETKKEVYPEESHVSERNLQTDEEFPTTEWTDVYSEEVEMARGRELDIYGNSEEDMLRYYVDISSPDYSSDGPTEEGYYPEMYVRQGEPLEDNMEEFILVKCGDDYMSSDEEGCDHRTMYVIPEEDNNVDDESDSKNAYAQESPKVEPSPDPYQEQCFEKLSLEKIRESPEFVMEEIECEFPEDDFDKEEERQLAEYERLESFVILEEKLSQVESDEEFEIDKEALAQSLSCSSEETLHEEDELTTTMTRSELQERTTGNEGVDSEDKHVQAAGGGGEARGCSPTFEKCDDHFTKIVTEEELQEQCSEGISGTSEDKGEHCRVGSDSPIDEERGVQRSFVEGLAAENTGSTKAELKETSSSQSDASFEVKIQAVQEVSGSSSDEKECPEDLKECASPRGKTPCSSSQSSESAVSSEESLSPTPADDLNSKLIARY